MKLNVMSAVRPLSWKRLYPIPGKRGGLTMAKCENCYHYEACLNSLSENKGLNNTDDFGKTVFLSLFTAERALEESEKNG